MPCSHPSFIREPERKLDNSRIFLTSNMIDYCTSCGLSGRAIADGWKFEVTEDLSLGATV